jgi:DNA-directed RNA polymerase subunit RPC12/RpoP
MRVLNDFKCHKCGDVIERYIDNTIHQITCECGGEAHRVLHVPRPKLDGTDPSLPGAYMKWGKDHIKRSEKNKQKNS